MTHFQYRFVSPPVKYSVNLENKDKDHGSEDEIKRREGGSKANFVCSFSKSCPFLLSLHLSSLNSISEKPNKICVPSINAMIGLIPDGWTGIHSLLISLPVALGLRLQQPSMAAPVQQGSSCLRQPRAHRAPHTTALRHGTHTRVRPGEGWLVSE